MALPGNSRNENADVIHAQSLGTTTTAGVGAAIVGLGGTIIGLLPEFAGLEVPVRLQVAGLLVVGLAIVGWGIATAGDALARAYATAHVDSDGKPLMGAVLSDATFGVSGIQNDGSDAKKPALAEALQRLAEAHENAIFGVSGIQNDGSDAKKPALAEALMRLGTHNGSARGHQMVEAPAGLTHRDGAQTIQVAALVFPREGLVQQLYFDASGRPRVTEPMEIAQEGDS